MKFNNKLYNAFTLIELLVVISIIGILVALSVFGMQGAKESSRDGKRKADLETIRSGVEMYKADCNIYPLSGTILPGQSLVGSGTPTTCLATNIYIAQVPADPLTTRSYRYTACGDGSRYVLCAALENTTTPNTSSVSCVTGAPIDCSAGCGGITCNYQVRSP